MKKLFVGMLVLGLAAVFSYPQLSFAKKPAEKKQAAENETQPGVAYLGIGVEPLHPALVAHLPKTLVDGQGVLVGQVVSDSPAAKAGLKQHDILVMYDDQKLFSPEQLVKLVRADKTGRKVQLEIVRDGKLESHTLMLGGRPAQVATPQPQPTPHHRWWQRIPDYIWHHQPPKTQSKQAEPWESFDSLALKKLDHNRYKAEIEYLGKEGQKQHHEFEGTREEIREQVKAEKDLPANEREQLLRSLDLGEEPIIPDFRYGPRWSREFDPLYYPWPEWPDPFREF